ncbi:TPA: hypothetical protein RPW15_001857 [Campylobacter fetus subsp. venerealis]|uniref:Uncharacterized protein n=1 Tax=Campylobacter fetus subsp. venerealis NCTC 10354 TaxID=983328 RepID=A0AAE6MAA8_CAMFE|nr:hypothetical protein [Campylobacter fetus]OCS25333.1 hypothetical protein CFVB10_09025 [Campylobacter fetus subsp. venerealis cfvB10]OCS29070.1 hypothetical protein CFVCCUG33900_08185 [Campylobacter fetus subsp. venerealis LMG 6570 = CCUG 33900]AIR80162.1 hypothetical protein CFV97608_0499 [Campylobacter fetus subsp. venerealis 97/608]EAK0836204.1 hypothetical protein [Campylobacter fetus]EGU23642.1 Hypothetical protein CFV354_0555 [Campylobacter fetus subsp. venerealis NCTC 10354]
MLSAGEYKELGFLMCVFGLINTQKDEANNEDIKVLEAFGEDISKLINRYEIADQQKAKTKAKKFLNAIVNRADKKRCDNRT